MSNAIVDTANGKVTLTLPIGDDGAAYLATMSPNEARDLASALIARAYTADRHNGVVTDEMAYTTAPTVAAQPDGQQI